jgi:hypothetical protein
MKIIEVAFAVLLSTGHVALAQESSQMTVGTLLEKNARILTCQDLGRLLPGASVTHYIVRGSKRVWKHEDDGSISGLRSDRSGAIGVTGSSGGTGTWKIDGQCQWCVTHTWTFALNQLANQDGWCRRLIELDGKYYGAANNSLKRPETPVGRYEFTAR